MPRFHCSPPLPASGEFELPPEAAHHAARVLRLREGDRVELFDGEGHACRGIVSTIAGKRVVVGDLTPAEGDRESPLRIVLAQSMSSSEKMDWVVQKAVELGAAVIQPLDTERSVARLSAERAEKRLEHWRQVAISACEQCGRNLLPEIRAPRDIMHWLRDMKENTESKLILLPEGASSLNSLPKPDKTAVLLIGPEGGFAPAEAETAMHCGFMPVRLGSRVLRTETAAIAGLAVLQTLWGDFR